MEVWAEMARIPANAVERTKIIQAHKTAGAERLLHLSFIWLLGCSVAPIWRDNVQQGGKSSLGGAPAGAQSYWQGRFAACAFVGGFFGIERPKNNWGVAPNPTRELRPLTPQGADEKGRSPPLDPSARFSWSLRHTMPACLSLFPRVYSF